MGETSDEQYRDIKQAGLTVWWGNAIKTGYLALMMGCSAVMSSTANPSGGGKLGDPMKSRGEKIRALPHSLRSAYVSR